MKVQTSDSRSICVSCGQHHAYPRVRETRAPQELRDELMELRTFKAQKAALEAELVALKAEVTDLRTRHEDELATLKRDLDLRNAATAAQCEKRLEEMERSVDERAMDRVDAVTKKTMAVNTRNRLEIENLHKEVPPPSRQPARASSRRFGAPPASAPEPASPRMRRRRPPRDTERTGLRRAGQGAGAGQRAAEAGQPDAPLQQPHAP